MYRALVLLLLGTFVAESMAYRTVPRFFARFAFVPARLNLRIPADAAAHAFRFVEHDGGYRESPASELDLSCLADAWPFEREGLRAELDAQRRCVLLFLTYERNRAKGSAAARLDLVPSDGAIAVRVHYYSPPVLGLTALMTAGLALGLQAGIPLAKMAFLAFIAAIIAFMLATSARGRVEKAARKIVTVLEKELRRLPARAPSRAS